MKHKKCWNLPLLSLILLTLILGMSGCGEKSDDTVSARPSSQASPSPSSTPTQTAEPSPEASPPASEAATLSLALTFQNADGSPLAEDTVQVALGGQSADYPTDSDGALRISGLPKEGTVKFTLKDEDEGQLGEISLEFAVGAVTDAASDGDGAGRVTVQESDSEAALDLTLQADGTFRCELHIADVSDV